MVAYELADGKEKWKWTGDAPSYSSPVLMTVGGSKVIIAMTDTRLVALNVADGKAMWETPFAVRAPFSESFSQRDGDLWCLVDAVPTHENAARVR